MNGEDAFAVLKTKTIAIVGIGLMGGSFALALKQANAGARILGIDRDPHARELARAGGAADEATDDLTRVRDADVVILATPVRAILELIPRVGELARAGTLILDLGSTKRAIVDAMNRLPESLRAVGAHPMCGKESRGFESADADLFHEKIFVLTPTARADESAMARARALVASVGARALVLDAARHDELVAITSHLPFALAAALMLTAQERAQHDADLFTLAASGFRDTTRLAASDETMMLDILLTNRANVANAMERFAEQFERLAQLVRAGESETLRAQLEAAAQARRALAGEETLA